MINSQGGDHGGGAGAAEVLLRGCGHHPGQGGWRPGGGSSACADSRAGGEAAEAEAAHHREAQVSPHIQRPRGLQVHLTFLTSDMISDHQSSNCK